MSQISGSPPFYMWQRAQGRVHVRIISDVQWAAREKHLWCATVSRLNLTAACKCQTFFLADGRVRFYINSGHFTTASLSPVCLPLSPFQGLCVLSLAFPCFSSFCSRKPLLQFLRFLHQILLSGFLLFLLLA